MNLLDNEKLELFLEKAQSLIFSDSHKEAVEILDEVIKIDHKNTIAREYKVLAFSKMDKNLEALEVIEEILKISGSDAYTLGVKGSLLLRLKRYHESLSIINEALKIEPGDVETLKNKGAIFLITKKYGEAIEVFSEILRINPEEISALNNRGAIFIIAGKYDEAIKDFSKALKINPKDETALNNMNTCLTDINNKNKNNKNNIITLDYQDIRTEHMTDGLLRAEKELLSIKKSVSLGAGLYSVGNDLSELIQELKPIFLNILYKYRSAHDLIINDNPFSEALFILSKMCYDKGHKDKGDEYKNLALKLDPNNKVYQQSNQEKI